MKHYDKQFMNILRRNLNIDTDKFRALIRETENELSHTLPENFDYMNLVDATCREYGITNTEYFTQYRYGYLGKARQSVCFIMRLMGAKNVQIIRLAGFSSSYVSNSIRIISDDVDALKHIERIIEEINDDTEID